MDKEQKIKDCWDKLVLEYDLKITNWLDECGVAIKELDYSIKERILTKKSRALQWITGYNEGVFILTGEKDADDTR